jgi:hypothetical protein
MNGSPLTLMVARLIVPPVKASVLLVPPDASVPSCR